MTAPTLEETVRRATLEAYLTTHLRVLSGGATVVCLVPSRTDTAWWHDYAMRGEIRFLRKRVAFVRTDGQRSRAPFPSAIVVFRPSGTPQ